MINVLIYVLTNLLLKNKSSHISYDLYNKHELDWRKISSNCLKDFDFTKKGGEKKMKVKIFRINKNNPLPTQANENDAGWDVYASETVYFQEEETHLVPLGIIAQAPKGYHFKLCIRSSMAWKKGFTLGNGTGIIDSNFSGTNDEIKMILTAPSHRQMSIKKLDYNVLRIDEGDRIGQLILEKNHNIEWDEQGDRNFAKVSRGGFGSSGEK